MGAALATLTVVPIFDLQYLSESSSDAQISGPRLWRSPAAAARLRRTAGPSPDSRYGSRAAAGPPDTAALLWMRLCRAALYRRFAIGSVSKGPRARGIA